MLNKFSKTVWDLRISACRLIYFPDLARRGNILHKSLCWLVDDYITLLRVARFHHDNQCALMLDISSSDCGPHRQARTCVSAQTVQRDSFHSSSWNERSLKIFPRRRRELQTSVKQLWHMQILFQWVLESLWRDYLNLFMWRLLQRRDPTLK